MEVMPNRFDLGKMKAISGEGFILQMGWVAGQ